MSILQPNSFKFILNIWKSWGPSKLYLRMEGREGISKPQHSLSASSIEHLPLLLWTQQEKKVLRVTSLHFDLSLSKPFNRERTLNSVLLIAWFLFGKFMPLALWYSSGEAAEHITMLYPYAWANKSLAWKITLITTILMQMKDDLVFKYLELYFHCTWLLMSLAEYQIKHFLCL